MNMKAFFYTHIIWMTTLFCGVGHASDITLRIGKQPEGLRIVFDSSMPLETGIYLGDADHTLLVNTLNGQVSSKLPAPVGMIQRVSAEPIGSQKSQVIFKANCPLTVVKKFSIAPGKTSKRHRFVVDLKGKATGEAVPPVAAPIEFSTTPLNNSPPKAPAKRTIIIDPGHGGPDPGTVSENRTLEKDITLKYARMLARTLRATQKYDVVMTRDQDKFISLGQRVKIGRLKKGDLFISLHADSSPKRSTRGLSIYTLSKIASDKEAARLASKENKADLFLGIDFDSEIPEVANILIDLTKRETMNLSVTFAQTLKSSLKSRLRLLDNTHRFANFAVLRTPDIPAVLVELGYLSNRDDERMLKSSTYLNKVCEGIAAAIDQYYKGQ